MNEIVRLVTLLVGLRSQPATESKVSHAGRMAPVREATNFLRLAAGPVLWINKGQQPSRVVLRYS